MKTTLAILAAGLGSRFGSDKQLEHIHSDNILLDYSIHDAIEAGFDQVVLIIRSEIEDLVKNHFKNKFEGTPISFVYQDRQTPKGIERKKPWGTGHALLCLKDAVDTPFLIINADDYYGKSAFKHMVQALKSQKERTFFSAGYRLQNTLSLNGSVSRGICTVDNQNRLQSIEEITKLRKFDNQKAIDEHSNRYFDLTSFVSMNFWGFSPEVFQMAEPLFEKFVQENQHDPKAEFYIPTIVQHAHDLGYDVQILPNDDAWFGMTYREDLQMVQTEILKLIQQGKYPQKI